MAPEPDQRRALAPERDVVSLSVAADPRRLAVVRVLVESVLLNDDFSLDTVADAKVAVDEVCTELLDIAGPAAHIDVAVEVFAGQACVSVVAAVDDGQTLPESGFGWYVVKSVTAGARVGYTDIGDRRHIRVDLTIARD